MSNILSVRAIDVAYGSIQVLRDVEFDVTEGEVLAIVGSNGAGKTTLLRALSGLLPLAKGQIVFQGRDISRASAPQIVEAGLAHAPEGRRVFGGMTVEENLRLGAYSWKDKTAASVLKMIDQMYGYFPRLRQRRKQLAGTMSGGEQQMCAIARALMARPKLLLIDELSLGLAPVIVDELLTTLGAIRDAGCTIALVEQDISIALSFADRAVVMKSGRVAMTGEAASLLASDEVAKSYLGG